MAASFDVALASANAPTCANAFASVVSPAQSLLLATTLPPANTSPRESMIAPVRPNAARDGPTARTSIGFGPLVPGPPTTVPTVKNGSVAGMFGRIQRVKKGPKFVLFVTASVAAELVVLPAEFVTTNEYAPASAAAAPVITSD